MNKEDCVFLGIMFLVLGFLTAFTIHEYFKSKDCEAKGGVYVNEYCLKVDTIK